jgi:hypothetical protein
MKRRRFSRLLAASVAGLASGAGASALARAADEKTPKHVCQGRNECKGQGGCQHGCGNNGCHGANDCKGKGGCASAAARHACEGKNECRSRGGCASGDQGCAARNTCKGKGGCAVPLKIEHTKDRDRQSKQG